MDDNTEIYERCNHHNSHLSHIAMYITVCLYSSATNVFMFAMTMYSLAVIHDTPWDLGPFTNLIVIV